MTLAIDPLAKSALVTRYWDFHVTMLSTVANFSHNANNPAVPGTAGLFAFLASGVTGTIEFAYICFALEHMLNRCN